MAEEPRVALDMDDLFKQANQHVIVRAAVRARAQKIANKARQIDNRENKGRANIELEEGYMPNGRFVTRVKSDDKSGEWGDTNTKRRATLRRAKDAT